ncbi:MAG TPA: lipopolysaccharide heptosyltransferase I [Burkholderiales bacterium]|jgi:heptosyltransferase-1|nr:lipopolysaccharide heptosyltransferase I [Burkholderiales bacterium]
MQRILLVKTTSLGDVIHCLPAVSDIAAHFPGVRLDWVVEEPYAGIVALHPAVTHAIPVAMRRWRKSLASRGTWSEIGRFKRLLAREGYDRVIDAQGLVKSALLARLAKGERHGLDASSAREGIATRTYSHRHHVPWTLDAVARNRRLLGLALGYTPRGEPRYGIEVAATSAGWLPRRPYCMLLTGTADGTKLWPEERWLALAQLAAAGGYTCLLPHGSSTEEARATRVAATLGEAGMLVPRMALTELAGVLAGAALVVGLDTGLTHLAAALNRPTVGIYCGSRPAETGVIAPQALSIGDLAAPPEAALVWAAACDLLARA